MRVGTRGVRAVRCASPEAFWAAVAEDIYWERRWDRVLDDSRPPYYRWFAGGVLNTCYNALDLHIDRGRGKQRALVYDSPVTDTDQDLHITSSCATRSPAWPGRSAVRASPKGDRVIIYMPMVPEAVIAMLACARIGAVHSVVFGGFASNELAKRIDDAKPRLILSASLRHRGQPRDLPTSRCSTGAIADGLAQAVERCVDPAAPAGAGRTLVAGRDLDWGDFVRRRAAPPSACRWPPPIRSTSSTPPGTTGSPEGRGARQRRPRGGAQVVAWSASTAWAPGEAFWAASDIGWVVGHSYIVYAPLLPGCTTILYEGKPVGTPDPGAFWRVIAQHGVNALFTAPTAFRAIKKEDPQGAHIEQVRPLALPHAVPGRRALRSRHAALGAQSSCSVPVDRPLVADRDRLGRSRPTAWGSACCRSSRARRPRRCRATTCAC